MKKPSLVSAPGLERNSTLILHTEHGASEYIWQALKLFS